MIELGGLTSQVGGFPKSLKLSDFAVIERAVSCQIELANF